MLLSLLFNGKVSMTDKPEISLSIMPTYRCHNYCEYCYLKREFHGAPKYAGNNDSDVLPRKIYKRLKELSAKYKITTVELYGGDLNSYNHTYLERIIEAYRCYCKNDRIMINPAYASMYGFNERQVNISINPERNDFAPNRALLYMYPHVGVITVATQKLIKLSVDEILSWYEPLHGNLTIMPYSNYSPNAPVPYVSNYEYCAFMIRFLSYYLQHKNKYHFTLTNLIMLKDCIDGLYSPAMRNNIFIEPSGHFACVDFDINGHEYFRTFDKLEKWEERCKQEDIERATYCGACEYFNTCMAEHFKAPNQLPWFALQNGDICNGYKPLVDWAKENLSGFSY